MFEDINLGPFMAVEDISKAKMQMHYDTLLSQLLIPVALVTDSENEVFKVFGRNENFKTKAVFINIIFLKNFEA